MVVLLSLQLLKQIGYCMVVVVTRDVDGEAVRVASNSIRNNKVRQIRDFIDSQAVHPPSHGLSERHFFGTPVCGFAAVTKETVELRKHMFYNRFQRPYCLSILPGSFLCSVPL